MRHEVIKTQPILIDCDYVFPEFAASYLLVDEGSAAFIENNTAHALPKLLTALQSQGLRPEQVKYVIITHVHLDHAGGSSALMNACPNAQLIAHPRAAMHVVDPSRLVASARKVYGDSEFDRLYGSIAPVSVERVQTMEDGASLRLGSRELVFLHTRGHANHHFCILDSASDGIFTGDTFGVAYPVLQKKGRFIFPSTSPTDFNPEEARKSIQKILDLKFSRAYLTHFGTIDQLSVAAEQLWRYIDFSEAILRSIERMGIADDQVYFYCLGETHRYFRQTLLEMGLGSESSIWQLLKVDIELNAAGLAHLIGKLRKSF